MSAYWPTRAGSPANSGFVTEIEPRKRASKVGDVAKLLVETFTPRALIFGSDWPVCLHAANFFEVFAVTRTSLSDLSPSEFEDVFSQSAKRWYRIDDREAESPTLVPSFQHLRLQLLLTGTPCTLDSDLSWNRSDPALVRT
jgi:amidohydrolase family protein